MPSSDKMIRSEVLRLAGEGRLVEECFAAFQGAVFPDAPPEVVAGMRICFFAGAAEVHSLLTLGLAEGDEATSEDLALMDAWVGEVAGFHEHTLAQLQEGTAAHG